MKPYLIVIPAFNEKESIARVLDDVKESSPFADILVVNDGSSDNTSEISRRAGVMVLDIPFNIGYGGAIQTGFRFAVESGYEFVITMDGDGQHDPYHAKNLIDSLEREEADVVIGSRFLEGTYKMGAVRKAGSWLFSKITKFYTGMNFTDPTSGFQLLNSKVFSYLAKADNYPLDYPDANMIMALHKMNFRVIEAPVRMVEKTSGASMHSGVRPFLYVIRMFLAIVMVLIRKED